MDENIKLIEIIGRIRKRIHVLGFSQIILANKSNLSCSTLNKLLHLKQKFSVINLLKIAEGLNVNPSYFFLNDEDIDILDYKYKDSLKEIERLNQIMNNNNISH
ncbi:MAG: helix-turn-helix transcriptional regulator [Salinivirgaceae bacterium]|nr:helix-turn-helix transcriptional regulator [Salinivirgaceae bacterium]